MWLSHGLLDEGVMHHLELEPSTGLTLVGTRYTLKPEIPRLFIPSTDIGTVRVKICY